MTNKEAAKVITDIITNKRLCPSQFKMYTNYLEPQINEALDKATKALDDHEFQKRMNEYWFNEYKIVCDGNLYAAQRTPHNYVKDVVLDVVLKENDRLNKRLKSIQAPDAQKSLQLLQEEVRNLQDQNAQIEEHCHKLKEENNKLKERTNSIAEAFQAAVDVYNSRRAW